METTKTTELSAIKNEVELELTNKENVGILVSTTFKGLNENTMKRALIEGMMRGFSFKDFLEKNIYAIPFAGGYSLVTSIDNSRKIGMRSGVVGKSAPVYVEQEGKLVSCEITIKRRVGDDIGEFTALVYFDEYNTGKNQWVTKPRTMIAKVAEMHALRMACPEELSQSYVEEEVQVRDITGRTLDIEGYAAKINAVQSAEELKAVWSLLPMEAKQALTEAKNELKKKFDLSATPKKVEATQPDVSAEVTTEDIMEALPPDMGGKKGKEKAVADVNQA